MEYNYLRAMKIQVAIPVLAVRKEPKHTSELVNQLLFGESIQILEEAPSWIYIKSEHDQYMGWVENKPWFFSEPKLLHEQFIIISFSAKILCNNQLMRIPFGSLVDWNNTELVSGDYCKTMTSDEAINIICDIFLNVPYLWGGRTGFGMDCSGLTQLFYRLKGISIKRDAYQQCMLGNDLFLSQVSGGDLLFYKNENERISHVGIALNHNTILHASGSVRIDSFDENGIFNKELNKYTHSFSFAKSLKEL